MDANEKELTTWGFTKGFRTGFITFILALQTTAIVFLYIDNSQSKDNELMRQEKLYEKMIDYMKPTKDKMESVADKVDTAASRAIQVSNKVDSLSNIKQP